MPLETLKTAIILGKKLSFEQTKKTAIDRAIMKLQKALPGKSDEYYVNLLEQIILSATQSGYTIESVTEATIKTAKAQR